MKKLIKVCLITMVLALNLTTVDAASGGVTYRWSVNRSSLNKYTSQANITSSNYAATMSVHLISEATYGTSRLAKNNVAHNQGDGYASVVHQFASNYTIHHVKGTFNFPGGPEVGIENY